MRIISSLRVLSILRYLPTLVAVVPKVTFVVPVPCVRTVAVAPPESVIVSPTILKTFAPGSRITSSPASAPVLSVPSKASSSPRISFSIIS